MSEICERCQAKDTIIEDDIEGIVVCTNCGLVLEENIIADEYEKRTFETDNNEIKRVGPPTRPEQATESGTYLVIRENGHTQKRTIYSKQTKIFKEIIFFLCFHTLYYYYYFFLYLMSLLGVIFRLIGESIR